MTVPRVPSLRARRTPSFLARLPFYYGWIVVAVAFVTVAIGTSVRTTISLLFPSTLDEFGWERGLTAAVFSLGFIVATLYSPFLGIGMRRLGPRYLLSLGASNLLSYVGLYDVAGCYDLASALTIGLCGLSSICIWIAAPRKVRSVAGRSRR